MARTLIVLLAVTLTVASAEAQQRGSLSSVLFPTPDSVQHPTLVKGIRTEVDDMKAALRDLITAQEKYFVDHDSYTTDGKVLDIFPTKHGQAQTQVTFASRDGWTGTATEPSLKGKNCVIYMGAVQDLLNGAPKTLGGIVAKGAGIPACDEP
jgi:hypothetical protein